MKANLLPANGQWQCFGKATNLASREDLLASSRHDWPERKLRAAYHLKTAFSGYVLVHVNSELRVQIPIQSATEVVRTRGIAGPATPTKFTVGGEGCPRGILWIPIFHWGSTWYTRVRPSSQLQTGLLPWVSQMQGH